MITKEQIAEWKKVAEADTFFSKDGTIEYRSLGSANLLFLALEYESLLEKSEKQSEIIQEAKNALKIILSRNSIYEKESQIGLIIISRIEQLEGERCR